VSEHGNVKSGWLYLIYGAILDAAPGYRHAAWFAVRDSVAATPPEVQGYAARTARTQADSGSSPASRIGVRRASSSSAIVPRSSA
jgi:hypothetical protein